MQANQQNQIESYLSGQMNADQLAKFESELKVNPELQQELSFQSEVINGIGEYRKTELIARMDALKVPSAWWSAVQQSATVQYVGGIIITGLIGTGVWFAFQNDENIGSESTSDTNEIIIDAPKQEVIVWDLPLIVEEESPTVVPEEITSSENEEPSEIKKIREIFNPKVAVPSAGDVESEKDFVPEQAGEPSSIAETKESTNPIGVEIIETKASKIKYRYYEGKLYLYGKFQQEPYEILEINSAAGRRIYLFHLDNFYQISSNDKPVELKAIANSKLIQELEILRKTK